MKPPKPTHIITFYRDAAREWRWNARHSNTRTIADSGEGYARRVDAIHAFERFCRAIELDAVAILFAEDGPAKRKPAKAKGRTP